MPNRLNVLLIEDNADGAAFIGRLFQRLSTRVVMEWTRKWQTGVERLGRGGLDAVLTNLDMPEAQGSDALRQIRRANPDIPIIVLAFLDDVEKASAALQHGAHDVLVKEHLSPELLLRAVENAVKKKHDAETLSDSQDAQHETETRLRAILNASLDCIITLDAEGVILDFNPAAERTFGYERAELLGKVMGKILMPEETRDRQRRNLETYKQKGEGSMLGKRIETMALRKNGERFVAEMATQPVPRHGELVFTIFLRDITERKKAEEAARHYSEELERSNRDLEQYASIVSHDLAAPLRGITGFCELLQRDYGEKLDSRADEFLAFIVEGAQRMQTLIEDLRAYSKISTDVKPFERIDCQAVMCRALEYLDIEILESGATVTNDPLPVVFADRTQLTQLFQNLIGNAIKYRGDKTPHVHISAKKLESEWQISLRDNGIGLAEDQFDSIFEIFQRAHAGDDRYPGTGIGLAICKRVVQRHGGRIWVTSTVGEGSTFYFTLPIEPSDPANRMGT